MKTLISRPDLDGQIVWTLVLSVSLLCGVLPALGVWGSGCFLVSGVHGFH